MPSQVAVDTWSQHLSILAHGTTPKNGHITPAGHRSTTNGTITSSGNISTTKGQSNNQMMHRWYRHLSNDSNHGNGHYYLGSWIIHHSRMYWRLRKTTAPASAGVYISIGLDSSAVGGMDIFASSSQYTVSQSPTMISDG